MPATDRPPRPGRTLALLALAQLIVSLDYTIVYVALPGIGTGLGFSAQQLQWVVSAYAVAFGGLLLPVALTLGRPARRPVTAPVPSRT